MTWPKQASVDEKMEDIICKRCIMDTTDLSISFDRDGICNHCKKYDEITAPNWPYYKLGEDGLKTLVEIIKSRRGSSEYDCLLGLSGGIDSSYLAVKAKELGLNALLFHIDTGWNSELAQSNIEKIVKSTGFDFITKVMFWPDMKSLQLSYLKSGLANQDVPQDHIFSSLLMRTAKDMKIKTILSGDNLSTECVFPRSWHVAPIDGVNLKAVHKSFNGAKLVDYKTISVFDFYFWMPFVRGVRFFRPLNYMPYNKQDALDKLVSEYGYRPYLQKHGESVFTKFFQNYFLPERFGYDKRKPHLSSLILTGQMTRKEALAQIQKPLYGPLELKRDKAYICKKLGITEEELMLYMARPIKSYREWDNSDWVLKGMKMFQMMARRFIGKQINPYY